METEKIIIERPPQETPEQKRRNARLERLGRIIDSLEKVTASVRAGKIQTPENITRIGYAIRYVMSPYKGTPQSRQALNAFKICSILTDRINHAEISRTHALNYLSDIRQTITDIMHNLPPDNSTATETACESLSSDTQLNTHGTAETRPQPHSDGTAGTAGRKARRTRKGNTGN